MQNWVKNVLKIHTVGPHGSGNINERGQRLTEFCEKEDLFICNTGFEQKVKSRSTWKHYNGVDEIQIDYILVNKRCRKSVTNLKQGKMQIVVQVMIPVWMAFKLRLIKQERKQVHKRWNLDVLNNKDVQKRFTDEVKKELQESSYKHNWNKLNACLTTVVAKICSKYKLVKMQNWITEATLEVTEERRIVKYNKSRYIELAREIRKMCRKAKQDYHESLCKEIEELNRNNPKSYDIIKKVTNKRTRINSNIKNRN